MIGSAAWEALRHCPSAFAAETQGSLAEAGAISFRTSIILSLDMDDDGPGVPVGWEVACDGSGGGGAGRVLGAAGISLQSSLGTGLAEA